MIFRISSNHREEAFRIINLHFVIYKLRPAEEVLNSEGVQLCFFLNAL